uniref:Uncharacterized protein n=1 Tax=Arundo donax TaxID=35708 RepID=A0A0A9F2W4_ARUDO
MISTMNSMMQQLSLNTKWQIKMPGMELLVVHHYYRQKWMHAWELIKMILATNIMILRLSVSYNQQIKTQAVNPLLHYRYHQRRIHT